MRDRDRTREYWERNIGNFGRFYADMSREEFATPGWSQFLYRNTIMRIEQQLMMKRYGITRRFVQEHVRPGMTAVDVGCGTGVFTVEMLRRGAHVIALDYAQSALDLTRALVEGTVPGRAGDVEYICADVTESPLPPSDVVIALGVTPYVDDLGKMYANILPTTTMFYCLVVDPDHWASRLRRVVPALNPRRMRFYHRKTVDGLLARHGFRLVEREPFGTGYLDLAVKAGGLGSEVPERTADVRHLVVGQPLEDG